MALELTVRSFEGYFLPDKMCSIFRSKEVASDDMLRAPVCSLDSVNPILTVYMPSMVA